MYVECFERMQTEEVCGTLNNMSPQETMMREYREVIASLFTVVPLNLSEVKLVKYEAADQLNGRWSCMRYKDGPNERRVQADRPCPIPVSSKHVRTERGFKH